MVRPLMVLALKPSQYLYLSLGLFCSGMIFYGIYNEIIIFRMPFKRVGTPIEQSTSVRKMIKLIFWNGEAWEKEEKEILYSQDTITTVHHVLTAWLAVQEEEHPESKSQATGPQKVTLQFIMLDASGREASISFDRSPLPKEASTAEKLLWVEGMLKTLQESGLSLQTVRLLVYAIPLEDQHLDFTHPWPLSGYFSAK